MTENSIKSFYDVLNTEAITTVYQPIISLEDGSILGYEALSRITIPECILNIKDLFQIADQQKKLWDLDRLCRTQALKNASTIPEGAKLFINVDPNIMHDPDIFSGFTSDKISQYGLNPNDIIFEITEHSAIKDIETFTKTVSHYQSQKYQIAIDDFGSGHSGMNRVCVFSPNFLKIDMMLIRNINIDMKKESAVDSIIRFCKEAGIKTIGEGIETEEELKTLIDLGLDYGQGYYFAKPTHDFNSISSGHCMFIQNRKAINKSVGVFGKIGLIAKRKHCILNTEKILSIYELMQNDPSITEVCILNESNSVCGLLSRTYVFQIVSGQFGYNLFKRHYAQDLIQNDFLVVDSYVPIEEVVDLAMGRETSKIYDAIVVTENNQYYGVVTIRDLLITALNIQVSKAKGSSPLTGLPGNMEIQKLISSIINKSTPFSLIYIDIDDFKPYNDAYGFTMGDQMIKTLSEIIKNHISSDEFVGHVGGDDFVIFTNNHRSEVLCQNIIHSFQTQTKSLYNQEDLSNGFIISRNRNGFTDKFLLATISIAVITNQSKKYSDLAELSKVVASTKKFAKMKTGNSIVVV